MISNMEKTQGHLEMVGLVKDIPNLPTDFVLNGSVFLAMDTGDVYVFNAENKEWIKLS